MQTGSSPDKLLGARVRDLRAARGISQTSLGEAIGVSFQQVQKYEKGVNRISASTLIEVGRALGVPVAFFFEGLETGPSDPAAIDQQSVGLVRDFSRIPSPKVRAKLAALIKELAAE